MSQLIHKCRKNQVILRDISCGTTCKKLHFTYQVLLPNHAEFRRCGFITSWNLFTRWTSWLVLLQQLNIKLSVVKCRPLRNHPSLGWYARLPCYAELSREKKAPNIKANTFRLFFFSKGQRVAHVICVTAHTKSVRSQFQFLCESGSTLIWGALFFFPLAMFSTVDGSVRLTISVTKFGLLQKM